MYPTPNGKQLFSFCVFGGVDGGDETHEGLVHPIRAKPAIPLLLERLARAPRE